MSDEGKKWVDCVRFLQSASFVSARFVARRFFFLGDVDKRISVSFCPSWKTLFRFVMRK